MNRDFEKARAGFSEHLAVRNYSVGEPGAVREGLGVFLPVPGRGGGIQDLKAVGRDTLKAYQLPGREKESPGGSLMRGERGALISGR